VLWKVTESRNGTTFVSTNVRTLADGSFSITRLLAPRAGIFASDRATRGPISRWAGDAHGCGSPRSRLCLWVEGQLDTVMVIEELRPTLPEAS
jgi:hypothetical protein